MNNKYKNQVKLLLDILLRVAKEACFAQHGGTAINLFNVYFIKNASPSCQDAAN